MNAIKVDRLTKIYRLYNSPRDRLREIISLNGKKYHHEFYALKDVSFDVGKGATVGIIGQNGSGKSTLLKIICGVLRQNEGIIQVTGRISSLLELGAGFNPEFSGRENVYMNGALMGYSREAMDRRFSDIEDFAEIGEFIEQPVKTYSSGMYVRLAFACAVNVDPDILVVDEALAVGDARFKLKCFYKFQELQERNKTILFVTHDVNTIKQYCSEAVLLNKGQIIFKGIPNEAVNIYSNILTSEDVKRERSSQLQVGKGNDDGRMSVSEYRYGSGDGEISDLRICDATGQSSNMFITGEETQIIYRVTSKREMKNPIFAMTIKDTKGQDIYVTNTHFKGIDLPKMAVGSAVEVSFIQKLHLIPNNYFISLGLVDLDNGKIIPLDRRYDVSEIKVLPRDKDFSGGIANLDSEIIVKPL